MLTNAAQVDKAVNSADQVILRDMILKRKLVEQHALRDLPRSHHASTSRSWQEVNQHQNQPAIEFFNTIGGKRTFAG